MDISLRTEDFAVEDRSWLGSAHGTEATPSGTLDVSTFVEADHYPDGFIPSGIAVGEITAAPGMYGPYDDTAVDGREVLVGHTFNSVKVSAGGPDVGCPILLHGQVIEANLPANHGVDAAGKADVDGSIIYR